MSLYENKMKYSEADPDRRERGSSHGQIFPFWNSALTFFQDIRWIILRYNIYFKNVQETLTKY